MKLKDIADMEDYLENRCYCPYEIYDMSGFFFQHFYPDMDCELISGGVRGAIHGSFVVVGDQIVYIEINDNRVESCIRIDATENNKRTILDFMSGKTDKMIFDEFKEGATENAVNDILKHADAIMVR